jgi:hypothetical protein
MHYGAIISCRTNDLLRPAHIAPFYRRAFAGDCSSSRQAHTAENNDERGRGELDPDHWLTLRMLPFRGVSCRSGIFGDGWTSASHNMRVTAAGTRSRQ